MQRKTRHPSWNRTNVDELAELSYDELDQRVTTVAGRVESRAARCQAEERDLTGREADLTRDDMHELGAFRDAGCRPAKSRCRVRGWSAAPSIDATGEHRAPVERRDHGCG